MNDIVYHSNIALMNSIKECLREDFGLLDKISEPINLPGIQNFQNNGIQTSYLLTQNFTRNKNKAFESENDDKKPGAAAAASMSSNSASNNFGVNLGVNNSNIINNNNNNNALNLNVNGINNSNNGGNSINANNLGLIAGNVSNNGINSSFSNLNLGGVDNHFPHCFQNSLIKDSFFIQVIGLKISAHPDASKLNQDLMEHFKCPKVSIIKLNDNQSYGTRVFFDSEEYMNKVMNSNKSHKVVIDEKQVKLKKKQAKEGNRLYAIYFDSVGKKGK